MEDTGPGIPEDELELVTNRFFRGRNKTALGSGLGLSIVTLALQAGGARLHLRTALTHQASVPRCYGVSRRFSADQERKALLNSATPPSNPISCRPNS